MTAFIIAKSFMDAESDALAASWRRTSSTTFLNNENVNVTYLYDNGQSFRGKPRGSVLYLAWGYKERRDWSQIALCIDMGRFVTRNVDDET